MLLFSFGPSLGVYPLYVLILILVFVWYLSLSCFYSGLLLCAGLDTCFGPVQVIVQAGVCLVHGWSCIFIGLVLLRFFFYFVKLGMSWHGSSPFFWGGGAWAWAWSGLGQVLELVLVYVLFLKGFFI